MTKLYAYGFYVNALFLMCSHLKDQKQAIYKKITVPAKLRKEEISVPQGCFDDPLSFNLFVNNLCLPVFLTETFLINYPDDNSLFIMERELESVKAILIKDFKTMIDWFYENFSY